MYSAGHTQFTSPQNHDFFENINAFSQNKKKADDGGKKKSMKKKWEVLRQNCHILLLQAKVNSLIEPVHPTTMTKII